VKCLVFTLRGRLQGALVAFAPITTVSTALPGAISAPSLSSQDLRSVRPAPSITAAEAG